MTDPRLVVEDDNPDTGIIDDGLGVPQGDPLTAADDIGEADSDDGSDVHTEGEP